MANPFRLGERTMPPLDASRRGFLAGLVGTSAVFGFVPEALARFDAAKPRLAPEDGKPPLFDPTIWFSIDQDGMVTINIIRAEMGQHVGSALARILADELEVDWDAVRVVHVDSDAQWGEMVTGGSWSVSQTWPIFSQAGAAGRMALIKAAAEGWGVDPATCQARSGVVSGGGQSKTYGDIIASLRDVQRISAEALKALPIKPPAERRLIGKPFMARDIAPKCDGTALFGIDARVEGMVYARPRIPPTRHGSKVTSVDETEAKKITGYLGHIVLEDPSETVTGYVAVLASSYYAAIKAADALKIQWTPGPGADTSEAALQQRALELIRDRKGGAILKTEKPDTGPAFDAAASKLEATYTTSTVLHFQLEPLNALALLKDGVMEIHTGNQWQTLILPSLVKALGMPKDKIVLRSYFLGGGFGRRLNGDYTVAAALAAKAWGKPVKMVWTRADDALFDSPRSASVQTLRMAFDGTRAILGMEHDACAGWPTLAMAPAAMPKGLEDKAYDPFSISGADHWYSVGPHRVRAINNDLAQKTFRPGWLRSVGPGWTNWALESFMDEAAAYLKQDALQFRLTLLDATGANAGSAPLSVGGAKRQAAVVKLAAERGGWGTKRADNRGLGLATSFGQERDMPTWVACCARVNVDRKTGVVRVEKLTLVVDAGTIVDPDSARAQMEGAALWGLSMALHEGTTFANGQVKDTNLDTYTPLRMADAPELDITFIESSEAPVGLGEPATTVIAPAIGNAIFDAVGIRLRDLPIRREAVLTALKA